MTLEIYNLNSDGIAYCEAKGLGRCFAAYAENCAGEEIMSIGFNPNSGYTYIALENDVQICSMLGGGVEYVRTSPKDGDEIFFDTYGEALAHDWDADENKN